MMFAMGTVFGSFFSLATYRIPRHQDIIATRSYCTTCKHKLSFFDLIPVLSYIIRQGKCKYCNEKISIRYFLFEMINGIVFVAMYLIFGYTLNLLFVAIIYVILFVIIGSLVMNSKISDEEKDEIRLKKKHNRKGVFISELVIAMILFTMLIASSFLLARNYTNKNVATIAKSNAMSLAIKNTEIALGTKYDNLNSFSSEENIDNITYKIATDVYKYSDIDLNKKDLVKIIETKVVYLLNGSPCEFVIKTLKGKVL